jgi:hypothetical protein
VASGRVGLLVKENRTDKHAWVGLLVIENRTNKHARVDNKNNNV